MTDSFEYLFRAIAAVARGKDVPAPGLAVQWENVFSLAREQTVFSLIAYAVKHQPQWMENQSLYWQAMQKLRNRVIRETLRRDAVQQLLGSLEQQGIQPVLLKGMGLAALYAVPECRESADVDIYVGQKQEKKAGQVFMQAGAHLVKERHADGQESAWFHPDVGTIELHAHLFSRENREYWFTRDAEFNGITAPFEPLKMKDGSKVWVLSVQDNALFLSFHLIKHFIRNSTNLRNILDLGLFFSAYGQTVDWDVYWKKLQSLQFDGIIHAALSACVYYGGFLPDEFPGIQLMDQETVRAFLSDVEKGGWLGMKNPQGRVESGQVYDRMLFRKRKKGSTLSYLWRKRRIGGRLLKSCFCPREVLQEKYPYAQRHPILLPVAWGQRLFSGLRRLANGQIRPVVLKTDLPVSPVSDERLALFRQLHIC